ncbi:MULTISPECIES: retention module-containing protein, partial [unclassified Photobacterium]|uniref:retention module-containing protein n=1 Tax=unclassified Photobacterium TaxID=2628852 RepID=UPI001EDEA6E3
MTSVNGKNLSTVKPINGDSFVLKSGDKVHPLIDEHALQPDEVLVANGDAKFIIINNGVEQIINQSCPTCTIITSEGAKTSELNEKIAFNYEGAANTTFASGKLSDIQSAILNGQDPTQLFEAPAAGNESAGSVGLNGSSSAASFITINYDNDALLAEAGFDTAYDPSRNTDNLDPLAILVPDGGELGSLLITEGDLSDNTYPVVSSTSIFVEAATLPLDTSSFFFDPLTINNVLNELNSQITSGGKAVTFIYDTATNTIVGTLDGQPVMSIALEATSENGRDVTVTVTTTINQPIDHSGDNASGLVSRDGDQINIDVAIQATDSSGNALDKPINVEIGVIDGANPEFGTDTGVTINESTQADQVIDGKIPLDVGSDAIATIHFNAEQAGLTAITSNGRETTFTVDGNVLTVLDASSQPVMVVTIANDGTYTVKVTGPIDQNSDDIANIKLDVTATDKDGDTAQGELNIIINDGALAAGGKLSAEVTEPTLESGHDSYTSAATADAHLTIKAGSDDLVSSSLAIVDKATVLNFFNGHLAGNSFKGLTSAGEKVTFEFSESETGSGTAIVLTGKNVSGHTVVTVTLTSTQLADGDVSVAMQIAQHLPLDEVTTGTYKVNEHLSLTVDDSHSLSLTLPVQLTDTDGDELSQPIDVNVTIKDGASPVFGTDAALSYQEVGHQTQTHESHIDLTLGSDTIKSLNFELSDAAKATLAGLTSNNQATEYTVDENVIHVFTGKASSPESEVLTITIEKDGKYTVTQHQALEQDNKAGDNIQLDLGIKATDFDNDSTSSAISITIQDGSLAAGGKLSAEVTEPTLESGHDSYTSA